MATIGKGYVSALEANKPPVAIVTPGEQEAVVGSIVKLDGRASHDPEGDDLSYEWTFLQVPIGSQVEKAGFNDLETDSSVVSFAPDIIGIYKIGLMVFDSNLLASELFVAEIDTRIILVPYHQGFCPDAGFIWNYLSDFWSKVDGKEHFEVFWEGSIQVVAGELLKVYQYDYNKSIKDIQDVIQRRWIHYTPAIELDDTTVSFVLADDKAGGGAESVVLDVDTGLPEDPQPDFTNYIGIPKTETNLEKQANGLEISRGRIITFGDRTFTVATVSHVFKSILKNLDGILTMATSDLESVPGTFTADMVGYTANILTGVNAGLSVPISAFIDSSTVTLDTPAWVSTETGIAFSIVPNVATHNSVLVDEEIVTTGLQNKSWRISATLISSDIDFEENGVSAGDVIEVEIARADVGLTCSINAQVTGVDRKRLGFLLNVDDLIAGQDGSGVSKTDQLKLANELQVPGLFVGQDRSLIYSDQAGLVYNTVRSIKFKRAYFEKELTTETEINVGAFNITVRPLRVIRNKRIPVDTTVVSIPVLQEYICQPGVSERDDGVFLIQTIGGVKETVREPVIILENLDYVIDDETTLRGLCNLITGDDLVEIPFGDLVDRSVHSGDDLIVEIAGLPTEFTISQIIDPEHVRVVPAPSVTLNGLPLQIKRKVGGKYVRFIDSTFSPKNPAPERLWAEVTYFNNNPNVENNFGVLVGISIEDIEKVNATTPYKTAVAGLMYALTTGTTVDNIHLAAQILLGLPFTQNAGVITEINPEYRLNDNGSPQTGRILIEARDKDDQPLGITNIYLYPRGREIPNPDVFGAWLDASPDIQGISINPETEKEYAVGDHIDQFVPLTKGVTVQNYIDQPNWFDGLIGANNRGLPIQIYHAFNLIINADLVTTADIDITAAFVKKARPHYTRLKTVLLKNVEDNVVVTDLVQFKIIVSLFEQESGSFPSALKYDKRDLDESFIQMSTMLDKYIEGDDLHTIKDSNTVTSAMGGFINARPLLGEDHDEPYLRYGDLLVIHNGHNAGTFKITNVISDTQVQVDLTDPIVVNFETLAPNADPLINPRQLFTIYRPIRNPIWTGNVTVVNGSATVSLGGGGLVSAGVANGDVLVFRTQTTPPLWSKRYTLIDVTRTFPGAQNIVLQTNVSEANGTYSAAIVREVLTESFYRLGEHPSFTGAAMTASFAASSPLVTVLTGPALVLAQILPGDILNVGDYSYDILRVEGATGKLRLKQNAGFTNASIAITVQRPGRGLFPITMNILDRVPGDFLGLTLLLSTTEAVNKLVTATGSPNVSTASSDNFIDRGIKVGDYLQILSGADAAVDTGHGPGVFLIQGFSGVSTIVLANNCTATQGAPGVRYAHIRKRPNEG